MLTLFVFEYLASPPDGAQTLLTSYRQMFSVNLGTTTDESISLDPHFPVHLLSFEKNIANHNRTFRIFLTKGTGDVSRIMLESAKPNKYYELNGRYAVSPETANLKWVNSNTLSFDGVNLAGMPTHFELRLNDLRMKESSLTHLSMQPFAQITGPD